MILFCPLAVGIYAGIIVMMLKINADIQETAKQ